MSQQRFQHPAGGYANIPPQVCRNIKRDRRLGYTILTGIFLIALIIGILYMTGVLGTGDTDPLPDLSWIS